ncbi:MAG: hypothetical protein PVF73_11380 [Bacteroidales bacterium]|jgi:hypothetical protein
MGIAGLWECANLGSVNEGKGELVWHRLRTRFAIVLTKAECFPEKTETGRQETGDGRPEFKDFCYLRASDDGLPVLAGIYFKKTRILYSE